MSGGSYNYIYSRLSDECENRMYDAEMDDLIKDLCEVLHDLEWWQSCDLSEESYRKTLSTFKKKWFKGDREQRLKGYIDGQISIIRSQLYSLIGYPQESVDNYITSISTATIPLSVIEDIKADIRLLYSNYGDGSGYEESRNIALNEVMIIIDKHTSGKKQA